MICNDHHETLEENECIISEFFITNKYGNPLIFKRYRPNVKIDAIKTFADMVKTKNVKKETSIEFFVENDDNFFTTIDRNSIYFVIVNKMYGYAYISHLLLQIIHFIKEFCGDISEESIQANSILIYEILDEIIDNGYVQLTNVSQVKPLIQTQPVIINPKISQHGIFGVEHTSYANADTKSVIQSSWTQAQRKNDVYIDVIENLSAVIEKNGNVKSFKLYGKIKMKTFLERYSNIKMSFKKPIRTSLPDKKLFREYNCVDLSLLKFSDSVVKQDLPGKGECFVQPKEGEFVIMDYELKENYCDLPIRASLSLNKSKLTQYSIDGVLSVQLLKLPIVYEAINVIVTLPLPEIVTSCTYTLNSKNSGNETIKFDKETHSFVWSKTKMMNGEQSLSSFKFSISKNEDISLNLESLLIKFELSGLAYSGIHVTSIKLLDGLTSVRSWIRHVTLTDDYRIDV